MAKKMGRPQKAIDWEALDKLCELQCTEEEIAQFLNVSADTLARACQREHQVTFAEYFAQKRGKGRTSLRRYQWRAAQAGNPTMLIWLGKQYLGQKDKSLHEHSGPDGKPISVAANLSDEELEAAINRYMEKELKNDQGTDQGSY